MRNLAWSSHRRLDLSPALWRALFPLVTPWARSQVTLRHRSDVTPFQGSQAQRGCHRPQPQTRKTSQREHYQHSLLPQFNSNNLRPSLSASTRRRSLNNSNNSSRQASNKVLLKKPFLLRLSSRTRCPTWACWIRKLIQVVHCWPRHNSRLQMSSVNSLSTVKETFSRYSRFSSHRSLICSDRRVRPQTIKWSQISILSQSRTLRRNLDKVVTHLVTRMLRKAPKTILLSL